MANIFSMTDTWNASGTAFTGIGMSVTNTASAAGSQLLDLKVGGTSKFNVDPNGDAQARSFLVRGTTSGVITITGAAAAGTYTLTLPTTDGNANEFLKTDGSGGLTWQVPPTVSDGDKTDITVSGSGTVWTIDDGAVTYAKIQNVSATDRFLGRMSGTAGPIQEMTVTNVKAILGLVAGDISGLSTIATSGSAGDLVTGVIPALRMPAHTGDVTSGTGSVALNIAADSVTYAKMQNVSATARMLGRITAGTGDVEELTGTQATTLLDTFTTSLKGLAPSSGGGTVNFLRADGTWQVPPGGGGLADGDKGEITVASSGTVWTIDAGVVTYAKMQNVSATDRLLGRSTAGAGVVEEITCTSFGRALLDDASVAAQRTTLGLSTVASSGSATDLTTGTLPAAQMPALTGNVTSTAGTVATTIANSVVTYAKIQNVTATNRVLGRITTGAGVVEELTAANVSTILGLAAVATSGSATDLTTGTLPSARAPAYTGDVTSAVNTTVNTIPNNTVTYAKMQDVSATDRLLGRSTAGAGDVEEITCTSFARTLLDDTTQAAARTTLGLTPGTDVQAQDAELAAIAGLTSAADRVPYFTGSGTASLATFTTFGRSLVDDADATAGRQTLVGAINAQSGTTYTFALTDAEKLVTFGSASATTVTVPPDSTAFPTGTQIDVAQVGAGKVTLAQGASVTILSQASNKSLAAQYAGATLRKTASNTWLLVGNLIA